MADKLISNQAFFAEVESSISEGECVTIRVQGRSMTPTFLDGKDIVTLARADFDGLVCGDIVLFHRSDGPVCLHRIVGRVPDVLYIRGDHNVGPFELARRGDVIGRVISGTTRGGKPFTADSEDWRKRSERVLRSYPFRNLLRKVRHCLAVPYHHLIKSDPR